MIRLMLVALVLSGLMLGSQAKAEVMKGSQLLADCHDGDNPSARDSTYKGGTCSGYITAVADALVPAGLYCVPDQVKAGQVLDIVKLYIEHHPDRQYMTAPKLIVEALAEKFPCN